jgi:hypothetical protein
VGGPCTRTGEGCTGALRPLRVQGSVANSFQYFPARSAKNFGPFLDAKMFAHSVTAYFTASVVLSGRNNVSEKSKIILLTEISSRKSSLGKLRPKLRCRFIRHIFDIFIWPLLKRSF